MERSDRWEWLGVRRACATPGGGEDQGSADNREGHAALVKHGGEAPVGGAAASAGVGRSAIEIEDVVEVGHEVRVGHGRDLVGAGLACVRVRGRGWEAKVSR